MAGSADQLATMTVSSNPADTPASHSGKFAVPWDITEWLDKPSLLSNIIEDIDSLDWANAELSRFLSANPNFQPRFLLVLMSYAYAMGICESEEMAEVYYRDADLKRLFPTPPPGPAALTRFRRENRGLLKWSVSQAFKRALRSHFNLGDTPIPAGLRRALNDAAATRIDVGRHLDRSVEAE
jgi:hypothetical protein